MGAVITCTVETFVAYIGELRLILCPLLGFSAIFLFFVCPWLDTFMSFI